MNTHILTLSELKDKKREMVRALIYGDYDSRNELIAEIDMISGAIRREEEKEQDIKNDSAVTY